MATHFPAVDELILKIHTAVLTQAGWSSLVNDLFGVLGATSGALCRPSLNPAQKPPWVHFLEIDAEEALTPYAKHWGRHDAWYLGALRTGRAQMGVVNQDAQLIERRDFLKTGFYNEYLKQLNIDRMINVCVAPPESSGYGAAAISFYRGVGQEPFSRQAVELLSHLAPHLCVATQNYWAVRSFALLSSAKDSALDSLSSALFALNDHGQVLYANRAGEELIRQKRWVRLEKGSLTAAKNLVDNQQIAETLRRANTGVGCRLIVSERVSAAQAYVCAAPLLPGEPLFLHGVHPAILVWITPITPPDAIQVLALLFGLTAAEQRLLHRLVAGEEVATAAETLGKSTNTVRTQLKSIFRKTGRKSQSQLLLLVARVGTLFMHGR
jgi:DNA-binding CsgD family transcriptional regulator